MSEPGTAFHRKRSRDVGVGRLKGATGTQVGCLRWTPSGSSGRSIRSCTGTG